MLTTEHKHVALPESKGHFADIYVNPIGSVQVIVDNKPKPMQGEFHQLKIIQSGSKSTLNCQNEWQLDLSQQDAKELALLLEKAEDEFEILMRDL